MRSPPSVVRRRPSSRPAPDACGGPTGTNPRRAWNAAAPSVRRQVTIIGWVDVAGAQRGPPPRLALGRERDRVLGPDDVAVDTGVVLGDEGEVWAQLQVWPGPDVARQVMFDIERGRVATGVRGAQTHVVDRVAIAGFSASDAHPGHGRRRP